MKVLHASTQDEIIVVADLVLKCLFIELFLHSFQINMQWDTSPERHGTQIRLQSTLLISYVYTTITSHYYFNVNSKSQLFFQYLVYHIEIWASQQSRMKKKKKCKDSILFGMIQDKDNSFHSSQSTRPKQDCIKQIIYVLNKFRVISLYLALQTSACNHFTQNQNGHFRTY